MIRENQPLLPGEEQEFFEEYFLKIEQVFAALRGRGLLLSPADYQLARSWYDRPIPLSCVLRGIRAAFYRKMSEGEDIEEEILSLNWCRWAVMKEWKEYKSVTISENEEVLSSPEKTGDEVVAILESILFDLLHTSTLDGISDQDRQVNLLQALAAELKELQKNWVSRQISLEDLEENLHEIDERMISQSIELLDDATRKKLEQAIERKLKQHAAKLTEDQREKIRITALRSKVRMHLKLPKITLYSL